MLALTCEVRPCRGGTVRNVIAIAVWAFSLCVKDVGARVAPQALKHGKWPVQRPCSRHAPGGATKPWRQEHGHQSNHLAIHHGEWVHMHREPHATSVPPRQLQQDTVLKKSTRDGTLLYIPNLGATPPMAARAPRLPRPFLLSGQVGESRNRLGGALWVPAEQE